MIVNIVSTVVVVISATVAHTVDIAADAGNKLLLFLMVAIPYTLRILSTLFTLVRGTGNQLARHGRLRLREVLVPPRILEAYKAIRKGSQ